ncbi:UNVERIFIED_CONTAM: hypothetical protein HDU68_000354 [Siphonaria sp. JEL0065]|nr:hypothetical protein HDU68_000354 [Siphonaria sp. JEL0065]
MESDIDAEITLIQGRYEKRLRNERDEGARLKGENGIMRKKLNTLTKDIDDNKGEDMRMKEDERKLRNVVAMLENAITNLWKEKCVENLYKQHCANDNTSQSFGDGTRSTARIYSSEIYLQEIKTLRRQTEKNANVYRLASCLSN